MGSAEKDEGNGLKNLDKGRVKALPLFHVKHYGEYGGGHPPHLSNLRWVGEFLLCSVSQQICLLIPGEKINFPKDPPLFFYFCANVKKILEKNS
jgi:hypothetical protein